MNYSKPWDILSKKEILANKTAIIFFGIITGIVVTALGAFVRIPLPFTPVPLTLQTFFVIFLGAALGRKYAAVTQFGYVLLGASGLPIFAGASFGLMHLSGPTGGYLIGFIAAAYLVGKLIPNTKPASYFQILRAMILGSLLILLFGTFQLAFIMHLDWKHAVVAGFLPFIPGDMLKSILAAGLYHSIQNRCRVFAR
ncbi:MAG: biotin transporter BioY [bacterium]|nr:biotin transporter BioY [bacterium]